MGLTVLLALPLAACALMILTVLGARRRGNPWSVALLSGIVFAVTWAVWYARDELPHEHDRTHA